MKKTKFSHKVISIFLTLTFLPSVMPMNYLYASNNGPNAPEAGSFEPVDATDMVNLVTGDMSYVLPLLNIPSPEGGYPLALSYHAGIGLDQEASWTGLGWNLNPGAINRRVSGVPDDWLETKKYSMMYNDIGVATNISAGVGKGSFAASLHYSSFKATGGETTHDFGVSASLGLNDVVSAGGYLGTNGVGANAAIGKKKGNLSSGVGLNAFQSFNGNGFSMGAGAGVSNSQFVGGSGIKTGGTAGIGINLSSKGLSGSIHAMGMSSTLFGGDKLNAAVHQEKKGFMLDVIFANFSYTKTKYWSFDGSYSVNNGSLYAGKVDETFQKLPDPLILGIDAYEATYQANKAEQLKDANFSHMSYDKYNINAQGIGGSISPKLLENGAMLMPMNTIRTQLSSTGAYESPVTNASYIKPSVASKNFSKSLDQKNIHFYFDNEYTSFLEVGADNWSSSFSSLVALNKFADLTEISQINTTFTDSKEVNGETFDSYNEANGRLKKGNYIETFTNKEINTSPSKIIQPEATGFSRTDQSVPEDGIGAFRVTALDGKTYHYSLPVYHKEQFNRVSNVGDNSEDKFFELQQFEPYATHWLLTAVTGADYFDYNQNNQVDDDDYGYWSSFEYGKWSDGFAWRSPNNGSQSNGIVNSYSWGIKEVYYLDKIKTRTHTALFLKDVREDNKSYSEDVSDGNDSKSYYLPFKRGLTPDSEGNYYSQGTHLSMDDIYEVQSLLEVSSYSTTSEFWIYADLAEQQSLRLDKIMLLKNEDAKDVVKNTSSATSSIYAGRLYANAEISLYQLASRIRGHSEDIDPDHTWQGEHYKNVLTNQDLDLADLTSKSIKTIDFDYDENYPLSRESSETKGKLTLNSVTFKGRQGLQLMPPYKFEYHSPNTTFTEDDIDDWGYFKDNAMMWSLNKITNPLGATVDITYENDRYVSEYSKPTTFFDSGLEFKYEGTTSSSKTLSFRNDADVDEKYHVDFTEYFTAGESTEIDVLFWHYTNGKNNWIADVAQNSLVKQVSSNLIVFTLPEEINQISGRENYNCSEKDWVYYLVFGSVSDQTGGWLKKTNDNSCERPEQGENRSKYKLFAQKEPLSNAIGGGVRVKELKVTGDVRTTKTIYSYTDANGEESGVTSYAVSKKQRVIPFVTELPSPMVMYENVSAEIRDANNVLTYKKAYQFDVPKPIQYLSDGVYVENVLKIQEQQNENFTDIPVDDETNIYEGYEDVDIQLSRIKVFDYSANIGRLKSAKEYNAANQLISSTENSYQPDNFEHSQGLLQETFSSYKKINDYGAKDTYVMTSSSKIKVPNVLEKTSATSNGFAQIQEILNYDFFTGQIKETSALLSDGRHLKSKIIPAYSVYAYANMGSKVDDPSNKNMLAQQAMSKTYIVDGVNEGLVGASITTWSPTTLLAEDGVWRKHKSFVWNGITSNGFYKYFTGEYDDFDWTLEENLVDVIQPSDWKQTSEISMYNNYSMPLEVVDINGNKAATLMGDQKSKTIATSNASYESIRYHGAEYNDLSPIVLVGKTDDRAHTGEYSVAITNEDGFKATMDEHTPGTYRISVWASKDNYQNAMVFDGTSVVEFNREKVIAGDWVMLNHEVELGEEAKYIYVTSNSGTTYFDDFRIHPVYASMTSYVYNEWDELSYVLGANNLATQYEYDEAGKLKRTLSEVQDFDGDGSGGFKLTGQYDYTYKYLTNQ